jgi:hypothetical protein
MTEPFGMDSLEPLPRFRPRRQKSVHLSAFGEEDSDHDGCESCGEASDDEYVPPTLNSRKCTRRSAASPAARPSSWSTAPNHPNKRARMAPPSRNKHAKIQSVESSDDDNDLVCHVCSWVQKNGRLPDFKRHVKTHQRAFEKDAQTGWWCKGVLLSEAADYGLCADAPTYKFLGEERVGGCMKNFSRGDALKRHLDNTNVSCVGRPSAATQ